jgi:hypothetical protein
LPIANDKKLTSCHRLWLGTVAKVARAVLVGGVAETEPLGF